MAKRHKWTNYILPTLGKGLGVGLFCFLLCSCHQEQVSTSDEEEELHDSLALHVAVMPVVDCLPIYYAERMGMFDKAGIRVSLSEYLSQMDCDTALTHGSAEVAYTDLVRVMELQSDTLPLHAVATLEGRMRLVTAHTKRLRNLKQLKERMVALDRLSRADYWSDELMKRTGLDQADIYRPQINDLSLRTSMLTEQLVDAALLPEPWATVAESKGNRCLFTTPKEASVHACLATRDQCMADSTRALQIKTFLTVCDKATDMLNNKVNRDSLRNILVQQYALPPAMADSIRLPRLARSSQPQQSEVETVRLWLLSRERRPARRSPL